jgi:hypothetical protein
VDFGELISCVEAAQAAYCVQAEDPVAWKQLQTVRRELARAFVIRPADQVAQSEIERLQSLVFSLISSGALDRPTLREDLALANAAARCGNGGLLCALLLTSAWQWTEAPKFSDVPEALMSDFVVWSFAPPKSFAVPDHAAIYPSRLMQLMESLVSFVRENPGSESAHIAQTAFLSHGKFIPDYFSRESLRRRAFELFRPVQAAVA